ncbi:MAG: hypothetical protein Q4A68_02040 [Anaerobiospirillum succiniciproducens]|uniref:hypothetical protein n=1 Tax=Anaerobiospirillum succiniciproducens TaxID=13335 RepID=UPI0026DB95F8|nr:hypothetical protein [Anaerobiospirillum succiniciproducens]MDO4675357.1 hypothetical protein [Anaerobiospirillum succiniciproducens]
MQKSLDVAYVPKLLGFKQRQEQLTVKRVEIKKPLAMWIARGFMKAKCYLGIGKGVTLLA